MLLWNIVPFFLIYTLNHRSQLDCSNKLSVLFLVVTFLCEDNNVQIVLQVL